MIFEKKSLRFFSPLIFASNHKNKVQRNLLVIVLVSRVVFSRD